MYPTLIQEKKEVESVQNRISEKVVISAKKKTMADSNLILGCLKNHFIFYNLSESELENIKEKMYYTNVGENEFVFETGQIGHCFFITERGLLEMIVDNKLKK